MKITIDTKEDSHDEIRRVIKMLSSLVGEKEIMSNQDIFSDESSGQSNDMFSMFSSPGSDASGSEAKTDEEKAGDKKEEDVDLGIPELEEYED